MVPGRQTRNQASQEETDRKYAIVRSYGTFNLCCCKTATIRFVILPPLLSLGIRRQNLDQCIYRARSRQGHHIGALVVSTMMPCMINGPLLQQADIPAVYQLGISTQSQSVPFGTVLTRSRHIFDRHNGNWACISSQRTVLREDSSTKSKK